MPSLETDQYYMRVALAFARRGLGRVAPNPSVGCVLVKDGVILSAARTSDGGRPHAEANALNKAGSAAKGATAYVSLEPCAHTGQTGPCAVALIKAGVVRVVIACSDPDPRVSGQGIEMLKSAGIAVEVGVLAREAMQVNQGFILRVTESRPAITLKVGASRDAKIAAAAGERTQISGALAQRYMHLERSRHDAILVGIETALVDDPLLTTRLAGLTHKGVRVVLDSDLRLSFDSRLVQSARDTALIIIHSAPRGDFPAPEGVECVQVEDTRDVGVCMAALAKRGITRLLVEGGAMIHESFLQSGLVDRFLHCISPVTIGEHGVSAPYLQNIEHYGLQRQESRILGEDVLEIYARTL